MQAGGLIHPGSETKGKRQKKSKTGVQMAPQKGPVSFKNVFKQVFCIKYPSVEVSLVARRLEDENYMHGFRRYIFKSHSDQTFGLNSVHQHICTDDMS